MSGWGALLPEDPRRVGSYAVAGRIGGGGQGTVYGGTAPDGAQVAIKVLHSHLSLDARARARFLNEVEAAKRVAPFCTVQVLDSGVLDHRPFLVSEYVPGPSLQQAVADGGPRSGASLDRLAVNTVTALAAIHRAGVVHRDFKPANVLLGPDGPVVIDFGIARALVSDLSTTSHVVGSPSYMAPEQIANAPVGPPADLFAWGATMVYAATGERAFTGGSIPGIMQAVLHSDPDLDRLKDPLRDIVRRCLAKNPDDRPTAEEVAALLLDHRPTTHTVPPSSPAEATAPETEPPPPDPADASPENATRADHTARPSPSAPPENTTRVDIPNQATEAPQPDATTRPSDVAGEGSTRTADAAEAGGTPQPSGVTQPGNATPSGGMVGTNGTAQPGSVPQPSEASQASDTAQTGGSVQARNAGQPSGTAQTSGAVQASGVARAGGAVQGGNAAQVGGAVQRGDVVGGAAWTGDATRPGGVGSASGVVVTVGESASAQGLVRRGRRGVVVGGAAAAVVVVLCGVIAFDFGTESRKERQKAVVMPPSASGAASKVPAVEKPSAKASSRSPKPERSSSSTPSPSASKTSGRPKPSSKPSSKPSRKPGGPPKGTPIGTMPYSVLDPYCRARGYARGTTLANGPYCISSSNQFVAVNMNSVCRWKFPAYPRAVLQSYNSVGGSWTCLSS